MMWLKACPRCAGDVLPESDLYGSYFSCLQCGYILRPEEEQWLISQPALAEIKVDTVLSDLRARALSWHAGGRETDPLRI